MDSDSAGAMVGEEPLNSQPRKKTRRAGQACDRCRSRKIKVYVLVPSADTTECNERAYVGFRETAHIC
jgi:hypothetical protein